MFKNRSYNLLHAYLIAVLAALSIATVVYAQQGESINAHITPAYRALKDRQLSQFDARMTQVDTLSLLSQILSGPVQAPPLGQVQVMPVTGSAETVVASSIPLSGAQRYADLKDAQVAQWEARGAILRLLSPKYQALKDRQNAVADW